MCPSTEAMIRFLGQPSSQDAMHRAVSAIRALPEVAR